MQRRFVALDGLRGIAALCVLLYHATYIPFLPRFANGYLAVDLFFLISGFILGHIYSPRLAAGTTLAQFTVVRLWRFYPLYFCGFMLGLGFAVAREAFGRTSGLYGLPWSPLFGVGMLPSFNLMGEPTAELYPFNGPSWSLLFEMILNVLLLPLLLRVDGRRCTLLIALCFAALSYFAISRGTLHFGFDFSGALPGLVRSAFSFALGVALFRWRPAIRLPNLWLAPVAMAVLLMPDIEPGLFQAIYDLAFVAVASPLIALCCIGARVPDGTVHAVYDLLGRLSYGARGLKGRAPSPSAGCGGRVIGG